MVTFFASGFCFDGDPISGVGRFRCTSLVNLVRHHAASLGVGVGSPRELGVTIGVELVVLGVDWPGISHALGIDALQGGVSWPMVGTVSTAVGL